jgi:TRAP-type transport system small permease protein
MKSAEKMIRKLEVGLNYISCIGLLAMMLLLTFDTAGRYILSKPIQGSYEITELVLMIMVVFLALSNCFKLGDQVKIDFFYQKFPIKVRVLLDGVMYIFSAAAFILIGSLGWELAHNALKHSEQTFGVISIPMVFSYIWIPIGVGVLSLRLLFESLKRFAYLKGSSSIDEDELNIGGSH